MSLVLRKLSARSLATTRTASSFSLTSVSQTHNTLARKNTQCHRFSTFYEDDEDITSRRKIALVLGSSGCLGRTVTRHLANQLDMQVLGADVVDLPDDTDTTLDAFISIPTWKQHPGLGELTGALVRGISDVLGEGEEIDVIICASGGFQGDPPLPKPDAEEEDFMRGAKEYGETIDNMLEMNLYPVLAAGYAANRFMADQGMYDYLPT
jgi:NAD(P)-dependent dehydrogenase (short-subunit alcohol dehydrogenase family)